MNIIRICILFITSVLITAAFLYQKDCKQYLYQDTIPVTNMTTCWKIYEYNFSVGSRPNLINNYIRKGNKVYRLEYNRSDEDHFKNRLFDAILPSVHWMRIYNPYIKDFRAHETDIKDYKTLRFFHNMVLNDSGIFLAWKKVLSIHWKNLKSLGSEYYSDGKSIYFLSPENYQYIRIKSADLKTFKVQTTKGSARIWKDKNNTYKRWVIVE